MILIKGKKNICYNKIKKKLIKGKKSTGARNNYGRITIYGRKSLIKKSYRIIDFKRLNNCISSVVKIQYDPNRSCNIALIRYISGYFSYILSTEKLIVGDKLISSNKSYFNEGNCLFLQYIPINVPIHNIELKSLKGGQVSRSAGTFSIIISKSESRVFLKLRSGEIRYFNKTCKATLGIVSNIYNKNKKLKNAGQKRLLGFKSKVRGVAKNPIDHPHGGGEGKASSGRHPVTKYGICTKGLKTRRNKRTNKYIIKTK